MKPKVAFYCRLSEEDRNKQVATDDSESIQNQKSMLLHYAIEQGWDISDIYSDDDYTGADRNRPEFKRLLKDAELRKFDIILCKSQSRFTRELELVEKYIHGLFPLWNIRFVSVVDNADTANKGNKKSRQINGLINEWYLEDMSENIKSVLTNKRKSGQHVGAFALYGYKKNPEQKGHLIIDEEAASVVREIFTLYSQGYGKHTIARMLNDRNIPSPMAYKHLKGVRYKESQKCSALWKYDSVNKILSDENYIGNLVQGRYGSISYKTKGNKPRPKDQWYIVEGTHEPIIEHELWDRVQSLMNQKAKPYKGGQIGLFAGKTRCNNCGYVMRSHQSRGKHYLQCRTRLVAKDKCIGSFISIERLERTIIAELNKLSAEYLDKDEVEQNVEFSNSLKEQKEAVEAEIMTFQKKITEYTKGIRELYLDKVKGIISESDYVELTKDFTTEKSRLEQLVADSQKQISDIEEKIAAGDNRLQVIEQYTNLEQLNRETIDHLIDYIIIEKRIPGTKEVPIEIHWNF